jgi:thiamine-monophosphate kinase
MTPRKIGEIGEAALLSDLVIPMLRYKDGRSYINGDDCAVLPIVPGASEVAFTIDCAPKPMFMAQMKSPDHYPHGWMSVLITYTDLLSMGAKDCGLLLSLELPQEMTVDHLTRLLQGVREASHHFEMPIVGGNVKDTPSLNIVTSGYGFLPPGQALLRSRVQTGDSVYIIGHSGYFIASFLARFQHSIGFGDEVFDRFFYLPTIHDVAFRYIVDRHRINAAMDSSDGPTGCLVDFARASKKDVVLESEWLQVAHPVRKVAELQGLNPKVLSLAWGNWEFVFTSSDPSLDTTVGKLRHDGIPISKIGWVRDGTGLAHIKKPSGMFLLRDISSKRFDKTSSFSGGFKTYIDSLRGLEF